MSNSLVERIWTDVSDRVGDDLRVVTRYKGPEFETRMRDDVRSQYTPDEDQTIVDDTIIQQLSLERAENSFKAGSLNGLVRLFDEAWVLSWPDSLQTKSGVIVSIQRHSTASLDDLDWCAQYLNDEIKPISD